MVPSLLPAGVAADEGAAHPQGFKIYNFASGRAMEASIQLIPKNTPQDCLRAQVFLFHEGRWEEGRAESKRPQQYRGDLGTPRVWERLRIIKSEGDLWSPVSSTREGSSSVLVRNPGVQNQR